MNFYSLLSGGIAGWWASIEDAMGDATINTIIGISVVFLSLLFISYVISLFKYVKKVFFYDKKRNPKGSYLIRLNLSFLV